MSFQILLANRHLQAKSVIFVFGINAFCSKLIKHLIFYPMKISQFSSIGFLLISVVFFSACSHRLTGTWTVSKYETETVGQQGLVLQNIGTMDFKGNGSGEKNLKYTIFGMERNDNMPFKWTATDQYVTIESSNSDFDKTWIIFKNKAKFQQWKSTDGKNQIQVLELVK
jgi:hypothetical protein